MYKLVIHGTYFSSVDENHVQSIENALICIGDSGQVELVLSSSDPLFEEELARARKQDILEELTDSQYLLPGFIDLHTHAPQWAQAGLALDLPLEKWLNNYTFPLEAHFADEDVAKAVYDDYVQKLLSLGTTTALMFGTIHLEANLMLAKIAAKYGLRAFVGQVVMDNPDQTPTYYRNVDYGSALSLTEKFINFMSEMQEKTGATLQPVITPRFVPSCTDEALAGLGELAKKYDLPIQSHVSESNWEHQYAINRFEMHDAEVLDSFNLLTDKSVMAHGTQLTVDDCSLLCKRQTAIAHCPISNMYFGNGVLPVKSLISHHHKLGIGSDISGGYSPSIYHNLRQAVGSSQMLEDGVDSRMNPQERGRDNARITMANAFYMATVGGGDALHLPVGKIEPGYLADFQIVRDHPPVIGQKSSDDIFQRLMYSTEEKDIEKVYVGGKLVYKKVGE
ncbi:amidohydrolase family protein [Lactobacillaceae bacterium 24-114]